MVDVRANMYKMPCGRFEVLLSIGDEVVPETMDIRTGGCLSCQCLGVCTAKLQGQHKFTFNELRNLAVECWNPRREGVTK
jgi:hypothetical protein